MYAKIIRVKCSHSSKPLPGCEIFRKDARLLGAYILSWFNEYKNYLLTFNDYHFIHGDLWYENYILNDNNELVGIVDFEGSGMGDPAYDIAALYYLGTDFINKVLSYYKYTDEDLIKRVSMLIKAREIADFDDMVKNYPEEVEEQVDKIKKVL